MTERTKATRESWKKILPMPEARKRLSVTKRFNQDEFERISFGLIPQRMEDKWFIFLENNQLNFHRSWTGHCIYQVRFEVADDEWSIKEAWVSDDKTEYKSDDDNYEVALLSFLIDNLPLVKDMPFPMPNKLPKNLPKGVYQHHIAGTGYPENEIKKNPQIQK